ERDPSKLQVFARVLNFRSVPATVRVRLEVRVGDELRAVYEKPDKGPLELPARSLVAAEPGRNEAGTRDTPGEGSVIFDVKDVDDRTNVVLHARLLDVRDTFPPDDEAWLVVGMVRKARVLIVTDRNEILQAFFDHPATAAVARVTYLTPADLK